MSKPSLISTKQINTNNDWGFGGWSGSIDKYSNGIIHHTGRNSYRHTGTSSHNEWYYEYAPGETVVICGSKGKNDKVYVFKLANGGEHSYPCRAIFAETPAEALKKLDKYYNKYLFFSESYEEDFIELETP